MLNLKILNETLKKKIIDTFKTPQYRFCVYFIIILLNKS